MKFQFDEAATQAHAAFEAGAKITDNPYPSGHKQCVMWEECYKLCESEHEFWSKHSVTVAAPVPIRRRQRQHQAEKGS